VPGRAGGGREGKATRRGEREAEVTAALGSGGVGLGRGGGGGRGARRGGGRVGARAESLLLAVRWGVAAGMVTPRHATGRPETSQYP
jgi:hypothetical protein